MLNDKLGFVFTNFNNATYTINAIKSLQNKINEEKIHVVVVDNNSAEDDIIVLKSFCENTNNIEVIFSGQNVGYFKGLNIGIKHLRENYREINCMIVGNNDVLFPENFYKSIFDNTNLLLKYPVVSPDIITSDGFHQNPHVVEGISKIREVFYDLYHSNYNIARIIIKLAKVTHKITRRKDEDNYEKAGEIYQGYGACYILTPKFFDLFEELYSPTFLMYEEYFLSKQLLDKGYKVFYEPSISLTHLMHASTDKLPGKLKWKFSKQSHIEYRKDIKII
ncbi:MULTISPECIES: glycosyltransferase family 2 protein [Flavobacterium]|uniref:glycosyltransferase family 2 protein n=1 Tax=Flavobacterium TaxID=237 RepID=UPI0011826B53|nr:MULTISPECIES: glycosyltransferase [Flavobacterium]MCR4030919.1 glycosyltransferase [Flavobacterium panacis]